MGLIIDSVGLKGNNNPRDVKVVQRLLNKHPLPPLSALSIDGVVGNKTIAAIKAFQSKKVGIKNPDGLVEPGKKTIRILNRGPNSNTGRKAINSNNSNLSGAVWWRANQTKYPNRQGLQYLDGGFKGKATKFVNALRKGGANVSIGSTRRDQIRAHLMHYSWKIAKGLIKPSDVPSIKGLNIIWDHGNETASRKAAKEMVRLFNMAFNASLTSNHIRGKAIDMTIKWTGELVLQVPGKSTVERISSGPKNGSSNRELHRIARKSFGVYKLLKDPPH